MPDIAAIWFDLDDTIYDHTFSVCRGMDAICARYPALGDRPAELAALYNQALNMVYTAHVRGEIDFQEMRRRKLKLFYEAAAVSAAAAPPIDEFHRVYDEAYTRERRATPGAAAMLKQLEGAGIPVAILTNGKQAIQEEKLRVIGLEWMIPHLLTAERARATKPDPRIYEWALRQTGHNAEEVLMVGDSLENDVEAALRHGFRAVHYAPAAVHDRVSTAHGPAPVIRDWSALPALLADIRTPIAIS